MAKEMLTSLEQKIDPRWAALLVIDMQNDFCAGGGALHRSGLRTGGEITGNTTSLGEEGTRYLRHYLLFKE